MTSIINNTSVFIALGDFLKKFLAEKRLQKRSFSEPGMMDLDSVIEKSRQTNPWFTDDNILDSLDAISSWLNEGDLAQWMNNYKKLLGEGRTAKRVGVVMAGNVPLVGFHDFLCVLLSGHIFVGKTSSQDPHLLPFLTGKLCELDPTLKDRIFFQERLKDIDAVIATGSDNSSRYFEYYFGILPHIIRKNRNSVAILSGNETAEELNLLGKDIFQYFGLGCRNVSKLYVPSGFDFDTFFKSIESYSAVYHHHKYANNYDYSKAIFLVGQIPFLDNGFLLLKNDASLASRTAVLNYEFYNNRDELLNKIAEKSYRIQCVVTAPFSGIADAIPFGQAQCPSLDDYADGVDTMEFLESL